MEEHSTLSERLIRIKRIHLIKARPSERVFMFQSCILRSILAYIFEGAPEYIKKGQRISWGLGAPETRQVPSGVKRFVRTTDLFLARYLK